MIEDGDMHAVFAAAAPDVPRRLVIVSDLVQHSEAFSFFRHDSWDTFRNSAGYDRLGRTLGGVSVQVERIARQVRRRDGSTIGKDELWDFWLPYFDVQGAGVVERRSIGDL